MADDARTDRIDELLRQEIGAILQREVDDPRIGFATITDVETTPDLRHAKVMVSVIGQPDERRGTLAAMGRAMPFVRHELGKRLRLKRIPEFHLELDESLERGTRVLHLLDELEAGRAPDDPEPPARRCQPRGRSFPRRGGSGRGSRERRRPTLAARENARRRTRRTPVGRTGRHAAPPVIDLTPWLDAVPSAVVDRLTAARRVLAVGHENPDADTLGATLAICRLVERAGASATAVFADPVPPLYDFLPAAARARTDPEPNVDYDLLVVSDCGSLDRIGAVVGRHPELFERLPRVVIDHHASNDAAAGRRLDRSGERGHLRDGGAARAPPGGTAGRWTAARWRPS